MTSTETRDAVEVEVRIAASPETIFDFFTDPDKMIQWMGRSAELDARPGGVMRCDLNGENIALGTFVDLDPPKRLRFTWGWEGGRGSVSPGESTIEVTLVPDGGETVVTLTHTGLPTEESRTAHGHGWDHYMGRLTAVAAGRDPGADPWATPEGARAGDS